MSITAEQCRFISDIWLNAASHYWYLEGYSDLDNYSDRKENKVYQRLFWNSVSAADYARLIELTD